MVGFGSSLRMGRRSGWESAYLDYETLKLLLSQIESVYEEHTEQEDEGGHHRLRDYRDELFLESDSDAAFASADDDDEDMEGAHSHEQQASRLTLLESSARQKQASTGFALLESVSSDESGSLEDETGQCGAVPWRIEKKQAPLKKNRPRQRYPDEENDFYVPNPRTSSGIKSFFLHEEGVDAFDTKTSSSLFNAPFQFNSLEGRATENSSLLGFANNDYPAVGDKTPPRQNYYDPGSAFIQTPHRRLSQSEQEQLTEERQKARKKRRHARKLRRNREKKVPPHIRAAHTKARSITERFLGLLRAEVEKVTLFAQARLGELADTAGSLRFLSSEELTQWSESFVGKAYEHPLSDGGIHPSASSSSDEGGGHGGRWSGSSSDENESESSHYSQPFGGGVSPTEKAAFSIMGVRKSAPDVLGQKKEQQEHYEAAQQKIQHFQELRRERPIFLRNDHIVGEDLLLISAVDEADAYSAVGVELLHILKYICVNVIAVRKICRKHDRLLQNRMLGGYYHRKRNTRAQEERTLGGLIAHVAGDVFEVHPALIGMVNNGKLMGVYDLKIQHLANSRTVKVISSCLALALSEYEVSRTRADALATLSKTYRKDHLVGKAVDSSPTRFVSFDFSKAADWVKTPGKKVHSDESFLSDDYQESGPPSTTSSVSLARLQFTVLSIAALREASRNKSNLFDTYLSRSSLSFTGHAVVGDGLDGCSRHTLDFMVYYTPDAALLLDSNTLYQGLKFGRWRHTSIASVMKSALAVALRGGKTFYEEEQIVVNALGILPKSEGLDSSAPMQGRTLPIGTFFSISRFVDIPKGLLRCNRRSLMLYTINYYMVHPTSTTLVAAAGVNPSYSAIIIGAANISAIIAASIHCLVLTGHSSSKHGKMNTTPYKALLIVSAVAAIAGNVVQALGIRQLSLLVVVAGRFLLGFSASSVVHRQFVSAFLYPSLVVPESARLIQFQAIGLAGGFFLGSMAELVSVRYAHYGVQSLQVSNWVMAALWLIHLCRLICATRVAEVHSTKEHDSSEDASRVHKMVNGVGDVESDSSDSDPSPGGPARLFHQPPEMRIRDGVMIDEVTTSSPRHSLQRGLGRTAFRKRRKRHAVVKRFRQLMEYNIAVPLSLVLLVYTIFAQEVLFSSCALITDRYFNWRGSISGLLLGLLSLFVLPIDFVCEQIARRYEERTTVKRSIIILGIGFLVMVNWGSLFAMAVNLQILFTETIDERHQHYDWLLGIPQYLVGFVVTFVGIKALNGASASLLSKVSPPHMVNVTTNLGTMVTVLGLIAQLLANCQIFAVGVSNRVISTDVVNSLVLPLLIGCMATYYFVKKHYFFMM